jgi:hypothetical protein
MPCRPDSLAFGVLAAMLWREGAIAAWYATHSRPHCRAPHLHQVDIRPIHARHRQFRLLLARTSFHGPPALCLLEPSGLWSRFLSLGFLREMGALSYCLYLIHLCILLLAHAILLYAQPRISDLPGLVVSVLALLISYALAKLTWLYFEHPLVRRGHTYRYSKP